MKNIVILGQLVRKKGKIPLERNDKFKATKTVTKKCVSDLGKKN
jgi:hypothetical protein